MPDAVQKLLQRLQQLNEVGAALSRERDIEHLLERILDAAQLLTHADAGTLYRVTEDGLALRFALVRTHSLGLHQGGSSGQAVNFPDLPLRLPDGRPNDSLVAVHAAVHDCTVSIADGDDSAGFDLAGARAFDHSTGYQSRSFLTVPLRNHDGELVGVLQLINAIDPGTGAVRAFSQQDRSLAESLASQAAIAVSNRLLISQLERLFESFVNLINGAIDEKSPYTGGHCERVPALTMMLAEAAHATTEGPLAAFAMTERDRYELKMAGLLHDCGKITTPVHVVDKATKLQTIYDRIGLVDTRFEVLKRDAEIDALRRQLALRPCVDEQAEAVANERVRAIGMQRQWRNVEGVQTAFLTAEEMENLTIRAGTLTQAERDTINYHIVATIKMLETLPWPRHLKNVPEYAGGHHERMDGKGYPRGLTREQMSVQARMMGIADIFEALTAADRPYKSGMKLSQALDIMEKMTRNGHIDPDLFAVFVAQRVYLRYAERFLDPTQVDTVA